MARKRQQESSDEAERLGAAASGGTVRTESPHSDHDNSDTLTAMAWSTAATLLLFLTFTHVGAMVYLGIDASVPRLLAPVALLLALGAGDWLARREGLSGRWRMAPPAVALFSVGLALLLASLFFDLSWDGQWYHQTAVYQMAHGWNPLRDPLREFSPDLQVWVRHYAKGPWYVAVALFETTGAIEAAKAATWLAFAAMFLAVLASAIDARIRRAPAVLIATLVSLNPVVVCELASYLVDGLMASYLACFVAALFRWIRRPSPLLLVIVLLSAVLCINAKLTGLVYIVCAAAAGGLYVVLWRRDQLLRYVLLHGSAVLLGTVVLGYNPYVTNTVHWGNPFYPWSGSAAHPGFSDKANDPNERYETPGNMVGRSRLHRLGFALFGRPGAQPICGGNDVQLMWPFTARWADLPMYRIHGLRIGGFGPLFSGAFLLGLGVLGMALLRGGIPRGVTLLLAGTIVASLLISTHTWWARYGPQLWWLPTVAVIAGLATQCRLAAHRTARILAALMLLNALLVASVHLRWEVEATRTLGRQFAQLRLQPGVEVDLQMFREPFAERLRAAGVTFHAVQDLKCDSPLELVSVAPGYPGAVRVCVHGHNRQAGPAPGTP
jgi:hypothetical protein